MRRIARKIISVLLIAQMILLFTWQVYADESLPEDQAASAVQSEIEQPEYPAEVEASAEPEADVTAEAEIPAAPEADEPAEAEASTEPEADVTAEAEASAEPEADLPAEEETPAESGADEPLIESVTAVHEAVSAPEASGGNAEKAETEKNITIDGTSLNGSEDSSGNGWTYEKESGRIVLRDYTASASITSDGMGVDIVSTGFNRIGTLSCDGDINIIGAGVLLIDKVELAKGCTFNLLPLREYYGEDGGSVAVFLMQEDGSYMLINRTVKGVIDENLLLPDDIKLVLPADSVLELQAFRVKVETDEDGNKTVIRDLSGYTETELEGDACEYYGGHLWVGDLTLNEGSSIINKKLNEAVVASINVAGNLVNDGLISGGSVTVVQNDSGSGGLYSGSGAIEDSYITLRTSQTMSINIKDSTLSLEGGECTIEKLGLTGSSELYYGGTLEIQNINGASGSSLNIYSFNLTHNLKLTGTVDRSDVLIKSGITDLEAGLKFLNGGAVNNVKYGDPVPDEEEVRDVNYGGPVFNYSGIDIVSDGIKGPVFLGPGNVVLPDPSSIPVVAFYLHKTVDYNWNITLTENMKEGQGYAILDDYNAAIHQNRQIIYRDLIDTYFPEGLDFLEDGQSIIFEVLRCKEGRLSMTVLGDGYENVTDSDGVFLIRLAYLDPWKNQHGGTTATSTRASQTGSGNIGGNSNSIFTGTGITRFSSVDPVDPDPEPEPDPEPDPDPKPEPDPNPKPDPDPVKPDPADPDDPDHVKTVKEYSVAAVNASGDRLTIRIDEFDLNEGEENAEKISCFSLSAFFNGVRVSELSRPVEVEMDYVLPEGSKDKPLYAVFANEDEASDEILTAVSAAYDDENGTLTFETSQVGEFIVAALEFDGEEFSPDFYDELEKTDEAKLFIKYLKEKKENAGL